MTYVVEPICVIMGFKIAANNARVATRLNYFSFPLFFVPFGILFRLSSALCINVYVKAYTYIYIYILTYIILIKPEKGVMKTGRDPGGSKSR